MAGTHHAEGTDLGSQRGATRHLATLDADHDFDDRGGVHLGRLAKQHRHRDSVTSRTQRAAVAHTDILQQL